MSFFDYKELYQYLLIHLKMWWWIYECMEDTTKVKEYATWILLLWIDSEYLIREMIPVIEAASKDETIEKERVEKLKEEEELLK